MDPPVVYKYLVLVLVLPVEQHLLKPLAPLDLCGQVGGARLEGHVARLIGSLHHHQQLEPLLGEAGGAHVVEGGVGLDGVHHVDGPDEEDTRLRGRLWLHLDVGHLLHQGW